jgi:hypothetical protein
MLFRITLNVVSTATVNVGNVQSAEFVVGDRSVDVVDRIEVNLAELRVDSADQLRSECVYAAILSTALEFCIRFCKSIRGCIMAVWTPD